MAGSGRFPLAFAEKARALGLRVVCVALRDAAEPSLAEWVERFYWTRPARLGRMVRLFKRAGVRHIVMAGKVPKANIMHKPWKALTLLPDWRTVRWWLRPRPNNKDDTILLSLIADFARDGLHFASALDICPELLVPPGIMTHRRPSAAEEADIDFGWELAREMGRLDVGQSVAVKERAVLAVEAIEGTDRAILRAGELCRNGGFTVVKVAKPKQDMRFDVPTIGTSTIEIMRQARARVLAIEADRTIVLDRAQTIALADRYGLTIVALPAGYVPRELSGTSGG
jgi:DUF1009 family protein